MPYDPRPVSKGGNRQFGVDLGGLQAAPGKFRIIGVDTFDGGDWLQDEVDTLAEAVKIADEHGGEMTKMYVYDDQGKRVHSAGTF